jgi:hypothetical protein
LFLSSICAFSINFKSTVAVSARILGPRVKPAVLTVRVNVGSRTEILHVGRARESALKIVVDVSGLWLLCWEGEGESREEDEERWDLIPLS